MSLRFQLVALFAGLLLGTLLLASGIGLRIAQRSVEREVRDRTLELASATTASLRRSDQDDQERLAATIRMHRGLIRAELTRASGAGQDGDDTTARLGPDGSILIEHRHGVLPAAGPRSAEVASIAGEHAVRAAVPFTDSKGRRSRLELLASLAEAERLISAERRALLSVAVVACLILIVGFWALLGRILVRRLNHLETAMRRVEQGQWDAAVTVPPTGGDELATVARGFNRMLAELRGFNAELTRKIDEATTELLRKNRALEELNELLVAARRDLTAQERLAALGQLAGTIAHELGNPLNAISGHLQLLSRRADLPESARAQATLVVGEAGRMAQIIRRFLDQTRGFKPVSEPVRLEPLIDEAIDLTLGAEARARVRVRREVAPEASAVQTDAGLLRHLLSNLAANAVDAMPAGGDLSVRARREGDELVIAVSDTGSGIAKEVRRRVFEPFFTTKPEGKGTGLGLAICKEIARGLHGQLDVDSELGQGTTFTLRFPAAPALSS